ncbi:MAG: hypothetical protein LBK25_04465 [Treponema sp.]|nr:hypothetical protein [Treponema sp.]
MSKGRRVSGAAVSDIGVWRGGGRGVRQRIGSACLQAHPSGVLKASRWGQRRLLSYTAPCEVV